jgi:hypothetical protein
MNNDINNDINLSVDAETVGGTSTLPETVGDTSPLSTPYVYPGLGRKEKFTIAFLERLVCEELSVDPASLHVRSRKRGVCFPRQLTYYLAVKYRHKIPQGENSLESLAAYYRQNHATVCHAAYRVIPNLISTNRQVREEVSNIEWKIDTMFL